MSDGGRMTQHVAFRSNGAFGKNQTSFAQIAAKNARSSVKKFKKAKKQ